MAQAIAGLNVATKMLPVTSVGSKDTYPKSVGASRRASFLHPRQKDTHQIQSQDTHQVQPDEASGDMESGEYNLFNVKDRNNHPMQVTATINGANLLLEVDTGATLSIISQNTYETLLADGKPPLLQPSGARLRTYTGEEIKVMGNLEVDVKLNGQEERLNLLV